jgi:hypothetical protein
MISAVRHSGAKIAFGLVGAIALSTAAHAAQTAPLYPNARPAPFAPPMATKVFLVSAPVSAVAAWYRSRLHDVTGELHGPGGSVAFREPRGSVSVSPYPAPGSTKTEIAIVR